MILTLPKSSIQIVNELHVSSSLTVGSTKGATTYCRYTEGGVGVGSTTQAHVSSWLRVRSKENCAYISHVVQVSDISQVIRQVSLLELIAWLLGRKLVNTFLLHTYYMLY